MFKLHLIDGTVIDIDRLAVDALLNADSDNYRLFGGTDVVQRAKKINPFQPMPDVAQPNKEWWIEPALKGR